jgi:acetyl-CoA/propionyl-CoA carboxylase biotin carboxyl carrier protein
VFAKALVANRGEIAVRVLRAFEELGIQSVAIYSDADRSAPHVRAAGEAHHVGGAPAAASYLNRERILEVAVASGCDAVHPGYGFLAEDAEFARACARAGLVFIGPQPDVIALMGDKTAARAHVVGLGLPIVPGSHEPVWSAAEALRQAEALGYPVAVKAAGGGGGIGFRVAQSEAELARAVDAVRADAARFFGTDSVYLERYFDNPRHVEVQLLGDSAGTVVHLGERDCSIQRRHQKLIEETPAPTIDEPTRQRLCAVAVEIAKSVAYSSAGTVEGLLVGDDFYFLEMNTRLQVEHGVTEAVTGIDIVNEQVLAAAGERLGFVQGDVSFNGVAIECRINAESAHKNFAPSPGRIQSYSEPVLEDVRVDSGVEEGFEVTPYYDSLLAKVIALGTTRAAATERMLAALDEFTIEGIGTLIPFHRALLTSDEWQRCQTARSLLGDPKWLRGLRPV